MGCPRSSSSMALLIRFGDSAASEEATVPEPARWGKRVSTSSSVHFLMAVAPPIHGLIPEQFVSLWVRCPGLASVFEFDPTKEKVMHSRFALRTVIWCLLLIVAQGQTRVLAAKVKVLVGAGYKKQFADLEEAACPTWSSWRPARAGSPASSPTATPSSDCPTAARAGKSCARERS